MYTDQTVQSLSRISMNYHLNFLRSNYTFNVTINYDQKKVRVENAEFLLMKGDVKKIKQEAKGRDETSKSGGVDGDPSEEENEVFIEDS